MHIYALKIRKTDLALITMLNDGVEPLIQRDTYYVFEVEDDGTPGYAKILSQREMLRTYDIRGTSPLLLKLKK